MQELILEKLFRQTYSESPDAIQPLKGDGSERRIYRLSNRHRSVIGVLGDNRGENEAFIAFSHHFHKNGLPVPAIYVADLDQGAYLEEDLGYETLFEWMHRIRQTEGFSDTIVEMYRQVLAWLPHFQITAGQSLDYSYCYQHASFAWDSMRWDLKYFRHRFLDVFYKRPIDRNALEKEMDRLVHHLLEERADYFLYRDFQSRNVMVRNGKTFFIDYQSGRRGALQYDVASLLYDAKANIPEPFRERLLHAYLTGLQEILPVNTERFMHYFYSFVAIRIMQAFGAYGYLAAVKGKRNFLASVPYAIANLEILLQKPTLVRELPLLRQIFIDLIEDQDLRQLKIEV
ncbi:phosphotransferase [candidate division KSB1 bacterium]|nr:phosphotransferase [candidate division KSB1 bacterium]